MKIILKKFWKIIAFGIALGFFEAAVVIYLRAIIYPEGFSFPLKDIPSNLFLYELGREISKIIMLIAVSTILGKNLLEKFCYFNFAFGTWDIFYYFWLKVTTGWPHSLLTDDLLFLIPVPWVGPVLAPVIVSLTLIIIAFAISYLKVQTYIIRISKIDWILTIIACTTIFISFIIDSQTILLNTMSPPYHWELLIIGELIAIFTFCRIYRRRI